MNRRRLKTAEKRMIEPVVVDAVAAVADLVDQIEVVLVEATRSLPAELRVEMFHEAMNRIGGQLYAGLAVMIETTR
jgi:hypothetical protein